MSTTTAVTYLFDPLCGWCYGASAALDDLAARPDFTIALAPTGLFSGAGARPMDDDFADYAWTNDQRISRLTGQPFSEAYRHYVLGDRTRLFDSAPATLALTAVALTAPDQEFAALKAIQNARYVDGRDITDITVLVQILLALNLHETGLATPADALVAAHRARVQLARETMRQFRLEGVPALIVGVGENRRVVRANALFGSIDVLVEGLKAA